MRGKTTGLAQGGREKNVSPVVDGARRRRIVGYQVDPMSRGDVERKAADVRRALSIDPLLPLPGIALFEGIGRYHIELKKQWIGLTYAVTQELPDNALACAIYDEAAAEISIVLTASSYRELERNDGRARFSVAHEIGHAVMHADKLVQLNRIDHGRRTMMRSDSEATPPYMDSEWQANRFAAALLMPAPGLEFLFIRGKLNVSELQNMYGVSRTCAERRIAEYLREQKSLLIGWN